MFRYLSWKLLLLRLVIMLVMLTILLYLWNYPNADRFYGVFMISFTAVGLIITIIGEYIYNRKLDMTE